MEKARFIEDNFARGFSGHIGVQEIGSTSSSLVCGVLNIKP